MKKISIMLVMLLILSTILVGCVSTTEVSNSKTLTAEEIALQLKAAGLPIGNIKIYNETNDPNKLMGRSKQYISKVNFVDTRLRQLDDSDPIGGSVEVFKTNADAKKRKSYIDDFGTSPMFMEYSIVNGTYLLRLDNGLTPEQADKYAAVFMEIK